MCNDPNFIGLCANCGVSEGYSWQRDNDPPDWASVCSECGGEDITALEETGIAESKHELILEAYQELADSSEHEERQQAKGFIKALEVLI